jgi:hypothetical protein
MKVGEDILKTIFEGPGVKMVPPNKVEHGRVYMVADKPNHAYLCVSYNLKETLLVSLDSDQAYPLNAFCNTLFVDVDATVIIRHGRIRDEDSEEA